MSLVKKNRIDTFHKNKRNLKKRVKELQRRARVLADLEKAAAAKTESKAKGSKAAG